MSSFPARSRQNRWPRSAGMLQMLAVALLSCSVVVAEVRFDETVKLKELMESAIRRVETREDLEPSSYPAVRSRPRRPLQRIDSREVESLRFLGPAHLPRFVQMVLREDTRDEIHAMLEILKQIQEEDPAPAFPIQLRVIPKSRKALEDFRLRDSSLLPYLVVDHGYETDDLWMRDWGQLAVTTDSSSPRAHLSVLHTGRHRGLEDFPAHLASELSAAYIRTTDVDDSGDYGGNLLLTPDDLLVVGDTISEGLRGFLAKAGYADRMVKVSSDWLQVGHVDEFMTFLPAPETPLGYVMIRADPALGMSLLQAMTPEERVQSLERTADAALRSAPLNPEVIDDDGAFLWETLQSLADVHGLLSDPATARSVDEELDVEELLEINRRASGIIAESQSRVRQAIEKRQQPGVHLEVLSFPTLYVNTSDGNLTTLVPEATNLLVLGRHLVIPDPLIPEFRKEVREVSEGLGYRVHFLSSLTYHDGFGQLHCASQVLRDPGRFVHPRYRDPARGSVQRLSRN